MLDFQIVSLLVFTVTYFQFLIQICFLGMVSQQSQQLLGSCFTYLRAGYFNNLKAEGDGRL